MGFPSAKGEGNSRNWNFLHLSYLNRAKENSTLGPVQYKYSIQLMSSLLTALTSGKHSKVFFTRYNLP